MLNILENTLVIDHDRFTNFISKTKNIETLNKFNTFVDMFSVIIYDAEQHLATKLIGNLVPQRFTWYDIKYFKFMHKLTTNDTLPRNYLQVTESKIKDFVFHFMEKRAAFANMKILDPFLSDIGIDFLDLTEKGGSSPFHFYEKSLDGDPALPRVWIKKICEFDESCYQEKIEALFND